MKRPEVTSEHAVFLGCQGHRNAPTLFLESGRGLSSTSSHSSLPRPQLGKTPPNKHSKGTRGHQGAHTTMLSS